MSEFLLQRDGGDFGVMLCYLSCYWGPDGCLEILFTAPYWTSIEDASGVLELRGVGLSLSPTQTDTLTL